MDRHLFALSTLATQQGLAPSLFACDAVAKLRKIIISTSTLQSEALVSGGFGPVNDDCYALGYGIRSYGAQVQAMTYKDHADAQAMADSIGSAMAEMHAAAMADA